jgi:hypothetical protein
MKEGFNKHGKSQKKELNRNPGKKKLFKKYN